ncbi:hypothetical protein RIF29_38648 [Crotalaria pallida]|uniref:Uncharacterized protein n=1 Tax=Crotalaria pallida TaxID=3830 RepID=A0AAN9E1J5_CROPI
MKVITIAGENRGAYMELVHSQKKKHEPNSLHKKSGNGSKIIGDGGVESEGSSSNEDKNYKGRTKSSFPMAAYMNSNVQCVNNSLLFHASCSHHDPGVRLTDSRITSNNSGGPNHTSKLVIPAHHTIIRSSQEGTCMLGYARSSSKFQASNQTKVRELTLLGSDEIRKRVSTRQRDLK